MANRFTQKKPTSKVLLLAVAAAGVVVGGWGAKTFLACPEAAYPACYHDMVKAGFNSFTGATYAGAFTSSPEGLAFKGTTNILCPVHVTGALMYVPEDGRDVITLEQQEALAEKGQVAMAFKPLAEDLKAERAYLVLRATPPTEKTHGFDITTVLPEEAILNPTPIKLK